MANEACTFSQLLRVGGKRSNWYSGTNRAHKILYTGISVGKMTSAWLLLYLALRARYLHIELLAMIVFKMDEIETAY